MQAASRTLPGLDAQQAVKITGEIADILAVVAERRWLGFFTGSETPRTIKLPA
jgi:hypothetical protein